MSVTVLCGPLSLILFPCLSESASGCVLGGWGDSDCWNGDGPLFAFMRPKKKGTGARFVPRLANLLVNPLLRVSKSRETHTRLFHPPKPKQRSFPPSLKTQTPTNPTRLQQTNRVRTPPFSSHLSPFSSHPNSIKNKHKHSHKNRNQMTSPNQDTPTTTILTTIPLPPTPPTTIATVIATIITHHHLHNAIFMTIDTI